MASMFSKQARIAATTGVIFILTLIWVCVCFQGMPASDIDDWNKVIMAYKIPWSNFSSSFFRPWSLCLNWDGQTEPLDGIHTKRIFLPLVLKLSLQFFGSSPFAMYFLTKGIAFAGCVAIIFFLLAQAVPWVYALLGATVFLFVPAHYSHVLWIADAVTLCYFFLFLGMLLFFLVQKNIFEDSSNKRFGWLLLMLLVAGWVGIKTKEPMLVLPLVVFFYSLTRFKVVGKAPLKLLLLAAAMALVAFQIVPITNLNNGSTPSINFNFGTLIRLLFRNYDCGSDNEAVPAFFSWGHIFPVSIARTLGFFALWSIVLSFGLFAWRKWGVKDKMVVPYWGHSLVQICGIWALVELPFLGMFQPDPRYFSGTMAPIIILIARLVYCAAEGSGKIWRRGLLSIWILSVAFNVVENVQNVISLRLVMGRKLNYFREIPRIVLEDLKGRKGLGELEVGEFYATAWNDGPATKKIKDFVFYADFAHEGWNRVPFKQDSLEGFQHWSQLGHRYYITAKDLDLGKWPHVRRLAVVDGINKGSLLESLVYRKKKKHPAQIKIYEYE
jgi:hypothetical protein